ncbi:hypothetical protein FS749_010599 [Ceratobasidium sp. UAMH 11750]|nr:hypothetical protein FS749_010599 [Ceratobasidium sp. UAMH 11750]
MMRRASGYGAPQNRSYDEWDENLNYDKSQDEDPVHKPGYAGQPRNQSFSRNSTYGQTPDSRIDHLSASRRRQPSGVLRSGVGPPSRLPSALKTPRSRSYSSSSSADSRAGAVEVPPLPHSSAAHPEVPAGNIYDTNALSYANTSTSSRSRSQSGLPRRAPSVSRSSSRPRSRNDNPKPDYPPPPLPGSNSDSDGAREFEGLSFRDHEKTPNPTSWAKDRRRFTNTSPLPGDAALGVPRVDPAGATPPAHVPSGRKSFLPSKPAVVPSTGGSSQTPSRSRIPSVSIKPSRAPVEQQQSLEAGTGIRLPSRPVDKSWDESSRIYSRSRSSQSDYSRRRGDPHPTENIELSRTRSELGVTAGADDSSRSQRRYSAADSKLKPIAPNENDGMDVVHISSMKDMPLPVPPLPQPDFVLKNRGTRDSWNAEEARPNTISSPLETILMGSNPEATPSARRMSTPMRSERESSIYVHATPAAPKTPNPRRFSEPSPGNGNGSSRTPVKDQTPKEEEAPPTILQRLVRRASFSAGKSPKPSDSTSKSPRGGAGTPQNQAEVEHYAESPFGLDIVTPRAIGDPRTGSSELGFDHSGVGLGVAQQDSSRHQKHWQSQLVVPTTTAGTKRPRPKAVDNVAGAQGDIEKLGSPFMGDGSPRFGIDERFRSPRARTKSGLREPREEEPQELFDYYPGDETASGAEDYLAEETPIATVLSSPGDARRRTAAKSPVPSSPMVQSKKKSQYQHGGRIHVEPAGITNAENRLRGKTSGDNSSLGTPRDHTPSRITLSPKAPDAIRENRTRTSSEASRTSQFSDSPDEQETISKPMGHPATRGERGGTSRQGD